MSSIPAGFFEKLENNKNSKLCVDELTISPRIPSSGENIPTGGRNGPIKMNGKEFSKQGTMTDLVLFLANNEFSEEENNFIKKSLERFDALGTVHKIAQERNAAFVFDTVANIFTTQSITNPLYSVLAGRIIASFIKLEVDTTFSESFEKVPKLYDPNYYSFVKHHGKELDKMIMDDNDWNFNIFAISTIKRSYLLRQRILTNEKTEREKKRVKRKFIETPQFLYMRVASYLWYPNFEKIKLTYNRLSRGEYSHATPTMFNAGFKNPSMASCYLLTIGDSLEEIEEGWKYCANISRNAGGAGCDMSQLRHSEITRGGKSKGIIPWTKISNSIFDAVDQGGKRKGSCAKYLRDFHDQIEVFIELKDPEGAESMRARELFYGIMVSDLFMRRVYDDEIWSVFCPNIAKGLCDIWGEEFEKLYLKYEKDGIWTKQIKARSLFEKMVSSHIKTGGPYIIYIDAVNRKSNQQHSGIIRCSNLCCEIMEVTSKDEVASCNLGSVCLNKCVKISDDGPYFDCEQLGIYTEELVENLNHVIDRNYYPPNIPGIKVSNERHRPLGIGVQGFADCLAMMNIAWTNKHGEVSKKARELNLKIFECMYYHALKKSNELGIRDGSYSRFEGSPISKGILQFDMWNKEGKTKPRPFYYKTKEEWEEMRNKVQLGMRNSLLIAPMPTASTAQMLGNGESFEPFTAYIYTRNVLSGQHIIVNKHLVEDMKKYGIWNTSNVRSILSSGGSIQNISGDIDPAVMERLKRKYQTVYEIPQRAILKMMIDRGRYICQSSSNNCHFSEPTLQKISAWLFYGWKHGIKTGMYYLRQLSSVDPLNHSIETIEIPSVTPKLPHNPSYQNWTVGHGGLKTGMFHPEKPFPTTSIVEIPSTPSKSKYATKRCTDEVCLSCGS